MGEGKSAGRKKKLDKKKQTKTIMEHPSGITGLVPGVSVWTKEKIGACRDPNVSRACVAFTLVLGGISHLLRATRRRRGGGRGWGGHHLDDSWHMRRVKHHP